MKTININGYGSIGVDDQYFSKISNKFSEEDLVSLWESGVRYIDEENIIPLDSIISSHNLKREVTKYNIEKVLPDYNLYNKDGVWVSKRGTDLKITLTEDSITGVSGDLGYNKTYNFSDYETVYGILVEIWEYNFDYSSND
jgi:hypothetical protein